MSSESRFSGVTTGYHFSDEHLHHHAITYFGVTDSFHSHCLWNNVLFGFVLFPKRQILNLFK